MTTLLTPSKTTSPLAEELKRFVAAARPRRLRTLTEFAEREIIIPDGPFEGLRFRTDRAPWTRLLFTAIDSRQFTEHHITGPSQAGKTLSGFVIPLLHILFEQRETLICGVPTSDMFADKWREDIEPAIARTRFREWLPRRGAGSKGGIGSAIQFTHGPTLRFMTGGGSDKTVAGFTTRNLVVTETDGFDKQGSTSREASRIRQLYARLRAFRGRERIITECTLSTVDGFTHRAITDGSDSAIMLPCHACNQYVKPEREHLIGWQNAETEHDARTATTFICPACGAPWTDDQRKHANAAAVLLHKGQSITPDGTIEGDDLTTRSFGFRFSAVNNPFIPAAEIGVDEWKAKRDPNEDNAEREMKQFVWALPYEPPRFTDNELKWDTLARRTRPIERAILPADTAHITVGVDIGRRLMHWVLLASRHDFACHIADYGRIEVASDQFGMEKAIHIALLQLHDFCSAGFAQEDHDEPRLPHQVWVDAGFQGGEEGKHHVVYQFMQEVSTDPTRRTDRYRPIIGRGEASKTRQKYLGPKNTGTIIQHLGDEYHVFRSLQHCVDIVEINVDHWKGYTHDRLRQQIHSLDGRLITPVPAGGMTLFQAPHVEHTWMCKHIVAEKQTLVVKPDAGSYVKFVKVGSQENHGLDALVYATTGAHLCGARIIVAPKTVTQTRRSPLVRPIGIPQPRIPGRNRP